MLKKIQSGVSLTDRGCGVTVEIRMGAGELVYIDYRRVRVVP